ncbi:MAG TPA: hypothetical protein VMI12_02115 [Puia sp.]|nr:hypothetical protein [Puia sp.]
MKKSLLLVVVTFSILISCKKSNPAGGVTNFDAQHLTCTIDGQPMIFNARLQATRTTTPTATYPLTVIAITGYLGQSGSNIPGLGIGWDNTSASATFGVGTWSDISSQYSIFGNYVIDSADAWESGTGSTGQARLSGYNITNPFKLVITYFDSTEVKGNFSGDFYFFGTVPSQKKTITDGDFVVRWK